MKIVDRYIDELLESTPEKPLWNQEMIRQGKKAHWNYIDGCMMTAFLTLYKRKGDSKYLHFVKEYIDYFITEEGTILTYDREAWNLDNINEGRALFALYDRFGDEKYRKAMDILYDQLINQPRTPEGNFWHKALYPNQIWLDGLYMAQPFYLEYEKRFNGKKNYGDILSQYRNVHRLLRDRKTGLYFHACDTSKEMFWCDKNTGLSPHFWLRAIGWFYMSLVDVLELLDEKDGEFQKVISGIFKELTDSLLKYQDESGMWFQIADMGSRRPNYLETSGSSIIAFALLKAVQLGILPRSRYIDGETAFKGICREHLYEKDGRMNLGGTCLVAGLGGKEKRDGSFEYYMSEPVVENEAKGIAPFILAYLHL
ncbi:MAG: glycoside hydrolase family 88 protein [Spirochaetales bacterium]|nr:glycoside hydrolase family 88 protein [Spirochaetales bacterium]